MGKSCQICGKKAITGSSIQRRGLAKKKGGVGKKTTGITKRKFLPNLQRRRALINGKIKKIFVCTECIKGGKITLPPRQVNLYNRPIRVHS
jgi:large subunit ribosomal protein L28